MSYANSRYQYGQVRYNDPSRFIEEISDKNIDSIISITQKPVFTEPKILGNFKKLGTPTPKLGIDPSQFVASDPTGIRPGMEVIHLKFGHGKVVDVDERLVATIVFNDLTEDKEKRIMLKFAKLQIVSE